jgi:hypothetical protein
MLHEISIKQRKLCEKCEYRAKEQDTIVFCIKANNCPKLKNTGGGSDGKKQI